MSTAPQPDERVMPLRWVLLPCVAVLLVGYVTLHWYAHFMLVGGDVVCYFLSSVWMRRGLVPYRDFALQYPPLALVPFGLPQWVFARHPLTFPEYLNATLVQNALLCLLLALFLRRTLNAGRFSSSPRTAATVFTGLVVTLSPFLPWRYDLFPALLTMLALFCVVKGRPGWAGVFLGFGIAAKLYPLVLLPVFGLYYCAGKQYCPLRRLMLGTMGALLVSLLPFARAGLPAVLSAFRLQTDRGLEIGSVASGVLLAAHGLGLGRVGLDFVLGSDQLDSPVAQHVLTLLPWLFIGVYGLALVICWTRFRQEYAEEGRIREDSLASLLAAALVIFIVTDRVFSPQYLIWLLPFAPLLRAPARRLLVAISLMTGLLFPFLFLSLLALHPSAVLLLNARNVLMVVLGTALLRVRRGCPPVPAAGLCPPGAEGALSGTLSPS